MNRIEELIASSQAGDERAKELLVTENTGLIWSVTRRFLGRGVDADDLYQLGCIGFLKAIDGFNLEYGTQFSTYAVPKIAGEIRRFLRDDGAVKVSRSIKEQAVVISNNRNKLIGLLGREPTLHELSFHTGLTVEEIAITENAMGGVESIHQTCGEDGFSLENVLTDTESEEKMIERLALRQAIAKLPDREKIVISLRFFHGLTQQRVASIMEVSQVQISRIEKKAIERLRERIT
jgi:RNA polymerase sporulation-specific sigma factor